MTATQRRIGWLGGMGRGICAMTLGLCLLVPGPGSVAWAQGKPGRTGIDDTLSPEQELARTLSRDLMEQIYTNPAYQGQYQRGAESFGGLSLPLDEVPEELELDQRDRSGAGFSTPTWVLYMALGILGVVVGLLAWAAMRDHAVAEESTKPEKAPDTGPAVTPEDASRPPPVDTDALRGQLRAADAALARGAFGDCLHHLVLALFVAVGRKPDADVGVAMTPRELATSPYIPARSRGTLARVIQSAELTWFGGRPADRDDAEGRRDDVRALLNDLGIRP